MQFVSGIVVFVLVWWAIFFITLPWGVEAQGANDHGGSTGAPKKTFLKEKGIITTCIAVVVAGVIIYILNYNPIDFREMATQMMIEDGLIEQKTVVSDGDE